MAGDEDVLTATGTILDFSASTADRAFFVSDPVVTEGDNGGRQAVFEIQLSQGAATDLTFDFETQDGTAVAGQDFVAQSGQVTFLAGQTLAAVTIDLVGDSSAEVTEAFSLVVTPDLAAASAVANAASDGAGIATILDNDGGPLPVINVVNARASEGDFLTFEVRLSEPSLGLVSVEFGFEFGDGTAQALSLIHI